MTPLALSLDGAILVEGMDEIDETDPASRHPILVVCAERQTRALLAAQLGESSARDVVSAPGVSEALGLGKIVGLEPALLVVDAGRRIPAEDVERLMGGVPRRPLILVASALRRAAFAPLREQCAAYLVRPVSIGRVAQAAVRVLERTINE